MCDSKAVMQRTFAIVVVVLVTACTLLFANRPGFAARTDAQADQALKDALAIGIQERTRMRPDETPEPDKHQATLRALRLVISQYDGTTASLTARAALAGLLVADGPQQNVKEGVQVAEALAREAPDTWQAGVALVTMSSYYHSRGRFEMQREDARPVVAAEQFRQGIATAEKALPLLSKLTYDEWRPYANPGEPSPQPEWLALCHLDIGLCAKDLGDHERARREWEVVVNKYPNTHNVQLAKKYLKELPPPPGHSK